MRWEKCHGTGPRRPKNRRLRIRAGQLQIPRISDEPLEVLIGFGGTADVAVARVGDTACLVGVQTAAGSEQGLEVAFSFGRLLPVLSVRADVIRDAWEAGHPDSPRDRSNLWAAGAVAAVAAFGIPLPKQVWFRTAVSSDCADLQRRRHQRIQGQGRLVKAVEGLQTRMEMHRVLATSE